MGDPPKRPDDASWTELERSFFASGPPEEPQPPGEEPSIDDLFPTLPAQPPARERFAWLLSSVAAGRARRLLAFASLGSIIAMGFLVGVVAFRNGVPSRPALAQATPDVSSLASGTAVQPHARSTTNARPPRADAASRPPRAYRKRAPASSSAKRPLMTASTDRETYWARPSQPAPARSGRPLFSR